ncbi:hypothetical protein Tco_1351450 [Tanacetum coccineum]
MSYIFCLRAEADEEYTACVRVGMRIALVKNTTFLFNSSGHGVISHGWNTLDMLPEVTVWLTGQSINSEHEGHDIKLKIKI